jgi:hypothetical protein
LHGPSHLDQTTPNLLKERNHLIDVSIARQLNSVSAKFLVQKSAESLRGTQVDPFVRGSLGLMMHDFGARMEIESQSPSLNSRPSHWDSGCIEFV